MWAEERRAMPEGVKTARGSQKRGRGVCAHVTCWACRHKKEKKKEKREKNLHRICAHMVTRMNCPTGHGLQAHVSPRQVCRCRWLRGQAGACQLGMQGKHEGT